MSYNALRKGRFSQPGQDYFLTLVTHRRRAVFQEFQAARLLIREMRRLETEQRLIWQAWVVMPDHLHGLISLKQCTLPENIRLLKGRSSHTVNAFCQKKGTLWQPAYYDHALRKEDNHKEIARYIVANPLRGGLVKSLGDYPHWDSIWLE